MSEEKPKEQEEQELGQEDLENVSGGILIGLNQAAQKVRLDPAAPSPKQPDTSSKLGFDIIKTTY